MVLGIVSFGIAAAAVGVAGYILSRRWKEIRLLDPTSIKEEQQRQQREAMIRRRFDRLRADQILPFKRIGRQLSRGISKAYSNAYEKLQAFEKVYQNAKSPFAAMAPSTRERIKTLLTEARSLMRDLKWADAERRCLEALSQDQRCVDAYKILGQIYLKQKLYPQAKETFEFVIKMKKADDATFAALAEIAEFDGDLTRAEAMRLKAVELSPRQSHRHAELAAFYLAKGEPAKAWPSAKRASDLEPTSAKYLETSLEAAIALGDVKEARARFDKLRLLTDDHAKFQSWREKIDGMKK